MSIDTNKAAVVVILVCVIAALLTGCADMTPKQKRYTAIAVSVVATGAIIAYQQDHGQDGDMSRSGKSGCSFSTSYCAGEGVGK